MAANVELLGAEPDMGALFERLAHFLPALPPAPPNASSGYSEAEDVMTILILQHTHGVISEAQRVRDRYDAQLQHLVRPTLPHSRSGIFRMTTRLQETAVHLGLPGGAGAVPPLLRSRPATRDEWLQREASELYRLALETAGHAPSMRARVEGSPVLRLIVRGDWSIGNAQRTIDREVHRRRGAVPDIKLWE